jgi:hypothetical protein
MLTILRVVHRDAQVLGSPQLLASQIFRTNIEKTGFLCEYRTHHNEHSRAAVQRHVKLRVGREVELAGRWTLWLVNVIQGLQMEVGRKNGANKAAVGR